MVKISNYQMSTIFEISEGISHHLDPLTAHDVELRETCYGAMDRTDTVVNIVVNMILIIIIF